MPHTVQVQKIVLIPRFTTFVGAQTFYTVPINVRDYHQVNVSTFAGVGIGSSPTIEVDVEDSPDLKFWSVHTDVSPTPGSESTPATLVLKREWLRLKVTLGGTNPAFSSWAVGDFVMRARRP